LAPRPRRNPRTLEAGWTGVNAIGDVTALPLANGQMLPKATALPKAQGEVVATRIAAVSGLDLLALSCQAACT
jgi:NADH dehydrogenase FAD-containing subunit